MFYEAAAKANEVLCLSTESLCCQNKRGGVTATGGATEWIH
ncbi:hypothetical protein ABZ890_38415 [Streptomyces sp. NPDC046984]